MSIEAADLKKLVKIVRQYEVIYGGGISTSDAAVREECESLVAHLETEIRVAPRGRRGDGGAAALPSLVEAKKPRREEKPVRPLRSRANELAGLAARRKDLREAPAAGGKGASGVAKGAAAPAKGGAAAKGGISSSKGATARIAARAGKPTRATEAALGKKPTKTKGSAAPQVPDATVSEAGDEELLSDLRSMDKGAARAAVERAKKRVNAGRSDDAATLAESKKRFAAQHLFDAFRQNKLPKYGGFIMCVRFSEESGYTVIEIIGYENLQDIYPEGDSLVFKSVGCKLFSIIEPPSFLLKSVEPVNRPSDQMVPYRFSELLHITTKRLQNIYVGRKPVFMPSSFSVVKPEGDDLVILFYDIADVYSNMQDFLIMLLRDRMNVPVGDSRKVAEVIARGIREFRLWLDEA